MAVCAGTAWADEMRATPAARPEKITVVLNSNYPPFAFIDSDGQPRGYTIDLWHLFEKHTGVAVELQLMNWADAQARLLEGKADVIGTIHRTSVREALYDFGPSRLTDETVIYVGKDIPGIKDPPTLQGFQVAVQRGAACADYLRSAGVHDLKYFSGNDALMAAIAARQERVFCMDSYSANYYLQRHARFDEFNRAFVLRSGRLYAAVAKGNKSMLALIEDGVGSITPEEIAILRERWLKPPSFLVAHARIIGASLFGIAVLLALFGLWVYLLRNAVEQRTQALQAKEERLRALLNTIPDLILIKDTHGVITECNRGAPLARDKTHRKILGKAAHDLLPPQAALRLGALEEKVMVTGRADVIMLDRIGEDGQLVHEEIQVNVLYDAAGNVAGTLSVVHDITHRLKMQDELRLWAHAVRQADFGIQILDIHAQSVVAVNDHFARERGYDADEMKGMSFMRLFPADIAAQQAGRLMRIEHMEHQVLETEHVKRSGERFPVLLDRSLYRDGAGRPRYIVVYATDITERKVAQMELRLAAVAFDAQDAMLVLDANGHIQRSNTAFHTLTGYAQEGVQGQSPFFLQTSANLKRPSAALCERLSDQNTWQGQLWLQPREGKPRVVRTHVSGVLDQESGVISHYVVAMVDITREHEAHARANWLTYFDALTDLPNRSHLFDQITLMLGERDAPGGVLLVIDLDHFKYVNELHGHAAGDALLVQMARRLRAQCGAQDSLARLSGGVFAWLTACDGRSETSCTATCAHLAERIREALTRPFVLEKGQRVDVTVSVGWRHFAPGEATAEEIFKQTELALYAAKGAGRNCVRQFKPAMQAALERQEALLAELRTALNQPTGNKLQLHVQPQFDAGDRIVCAELLLRWQRANGESCPPDDFIPLAEENGLIETLGAWVLHQACHQLAQWASDPVMRDVSLAVNVSAHQFTRPQFVPFMRRILQAHTAPAGRLILEITESALLGDLQIVSTRLHELRALGVRIALDDFGTGYSSLSYLSRLPIDELKIDRIFVTRLPQEPVDAAVAHMVIGMAHSLGLQVVAEGVETDAQRDWLLAQGCDLLQGYLLARPMPLSAYEAFLKDRRAAPTGAV